MRMVRNFLIGAGALAIAGVALAAAAPVHVKDVVLPNGIVAHIRYTGDVAPQLVLTPVARVAPIAMLDPFGAGSPFAELDRISAAMDRQADMMLRQAAALARQAPAMSSAPNLVAARNLPAGSVVHYSFVSTSNGTGTCSQSVQVTSAGGNAQPKVISNQSGDCSKMGIAAPRAVSAPAAPAAPAVPLPVSAPKAPAPPKLPADTI